MNGYVGGAEMEEETPDMFPDTTFDIATFNTPEAELTGNTTSCYICARSFHQLPAEYVVKRNYSYSGGWMAGYFMTYCVWCAHSYGL